MQKLVQGIDGVQYVVRKLFPPAERKAACALVITEEAQIFLLVRSDLYGAFQGESVDASLVRQFSGVEWPGQSQDDGAFAKRKQLIDALGRFCGSLGLNGAALEDVQTSKRPGWVRRPLVG